MDIDSKSGGAIRQRNQTLILQASAKQFAKYGYKGTSLQAIADCVDLPKANILYYFKSKSGLYKALLSDIMDMWNQGFSADKSQLDPASVLRTYIEQKMQYSRTHPLQSKIFAMEIIQGAPNIRDILERPMVQWTHQQHNVIDAWVEQGLLPKIDPYYLLFMIWGTTQFYADFDTEIALLKGRELNESEFLQAQEFTVTTILRGLKLID